MALHSLIKFYMLFSVLLCADAGRGRAPGPFTVVGSKIFDSDGNWIVFKDEAGAPDWPGKFAWSACFGGVPAPNASFALNNETVNVLNYLKPDTAGGNFVTSPSVKKVAFQAPYDEVVDMGQPKSHPIIRIPITASSYLYDEEDNKLGATGYRAILDMLVTYFTSNGVAVILDLHGNCASGGGIKGCGAGHDAGAMALRMYGNLTGAGAFWDMAAAKYADNPLVLYELYNEPHVWYQAWYGNDSTYIGMQELYDVVRSHTPTGLVVIGGRDQYALDVASQLGFWTQYANKFKRFPTNVIFNFHPYQGVYQGLEHSLRSVMRLTLAAKTVAPVIYTELGQYCCNAGPARGCQSSNICNDHNHSDWFVHNLINMATQYDASFVGWAWRGTNANDGNCTQGQTVCNSPDMRDVGGVLTNGSSGGANWAEVWSTFVANATIVVQDTPVPGINTSDYQPAGFLPRPCMTGTFNLAGFCGWPLGTNVSGLAWTDFFNQTLFQAVLPGLPPSGPPSSCDQQACPGYTCSTDYPGWPPLSPCK